MTVAAAAADPVWLLPDVPPWSSAAVDVQSFTAGMRLNVDAGYMISGKRVWIPSVDPALRYAVILRDVTDPDNPIEETSAVYAGDAFAAPGWVSTVEAATPIAGGVYEFVVVHYSTAASTSFVAPFNYRTTNGNDLPLTGEAVDRTRSPNTFRISDTDADGGDRTAELATIQPGTTITFGVLGDHTVQTVTQLVGYTETTVTRNPFGEPNDGRYDMTFDVPGSAITPAVWLVDYWATATTVEGVSAINDGPLVADANAYGVDLFVSEATAGAPIDDPRRYHAALMVAARLVARRDSPVGIAGGFETGPIYVQRRDPDIADLLIGLRYTDDPLTNQTWPTLAELKTYVGVTTSVDDATLTGILDAAVGVVTRKLRGGFGFA